MYEGNNFNGFLIKKAENFSYFDPIDNSIVPNQGIRIILSGGQRLVLRTSGTETKESTIRIYIEKYESNPLNYFQSTQKHLKDLIKLSNEIFQLKSKINRNIPNVIT